VGLHHGTCPPPTRAGPSGHRADRAGGTLPSVPVSFDAYASSVASGESAGCVSLCGVPSSRVGGRPAKCQRSKLAPAASLANCQLELPCLTPRSANRDERGWPTPSSGNDRELSEPSSQPHRLAAADVQDQQALFGCHAGSSPMPSPGSVSSPRCATVVTSSACRRAFCAAASGCE
jgi:hypothetical protein